MPSGMLRAHLQHPQSVLRVLMPGGTDVGTQGLPACVTGGRTTLWDSDSRQLTQSQLQFLIPVGQQQKMSPATTQRHLLGVQLVLLRLDSLYALTAMRRNPQKW